MIPRIFKARLVRALFFYLAKFFFDNFRQTLRGDGLARRRCRPVSPAGLQTLLSKSQSNSSLSR
jgi:hypothetical protein